MLLPISGMLPTMNAGKLSMSEGSFKGSSVPFMEILTAGKKISLLTNKT
jgi:hypothetical protein